MLNKLKNKLSRPIYIEPLVNYVEYSSIDYSYTGGSLSESNILIITNISIPENLILTAEDTERASISLLYVTDDISEDIITTSGGKLIGPYTHVINIFRKNDELEVLSKEGDFSNTDAMHQVYQWLQIEASYLISLNQHATIATAYIGDKTTYSSCLKKNIEMCIGGLGEALSNHNIICNGVVSSNSVPVKDILNTCLFLSSKFGQILVGEVINMEK